MAISEGVSSGTGGGESLSAYLSGEEDANRFRPKLSGSSGVQEFRSSGVQEFRSSGVQEFRERRKMEG
jgi:hypothetical protein